MTDTTPARAYMIASRHEFGGVSGTPVPEDDGRMLARSCWFDEKTGDASAMRACVIDGEDSGPGTLFQLFLLYIEWLFEVVREELPLRVRNLGRANSSE